MSKLDVTDRAVAGGWTLPEGWTVQAETREDDDLIGDPSEEYDCYTPKQVEAWRRGDWGFVYISVWVTDGSDREWGHSGIGSVEAGWFVMTDEDDNVTGEVSIDPLTDTPGEYSVIREYDLIGEALRDAMAELERFDTPVLVDPGNGLSGP